MEHRITTKQLKVLTNKLILRGEYDFEYICLRIIFATWKKSKSQKTETYDMLCCVYVQWRVK